MLALTALWGVPVVATAQEQPLVFVHGLFSSGGVWQPTANVLEDQFAIRSFLPTLGWANSFSTQANNLHASIAGTFGTVAVANSNGGLVTREYLRQFGGSSRIDRAITIGTPHGGAALAAHALNGNLILYGDVLFSSIADPIDYYYTFDPAFRDAFDFGPLRFFRFAAEVMASLARSLNIIINVVGVPIPGITNTEVLPQMPPGSSFISTLNAPSNVANEAAVTLSRVGVATSIPPQNAFFRNFSDNPQAWGSVRRGLMSFALLMYSHYSAHPDFFLRANADRWLFMFFVLRDFDVVWHFFIGSLVDYNGFVAVVDHQDGLVPRASATWPGADRQRDLLFPAFNIVHRQQTVHPDARREISNTFRDVFGIPVRPPPPPPGGGGDDCIPEPPAIVCNS
ncbi:MAG: esterase/lipase family protein [Gemmatimonadaceae bacterium]